MLLIALSIVITLAAMFTAGHIVLGRSKAGRVVAWAASTALVAFILVGLVLSFRLHGPASRFAPGSVEFIARRWLILPGEFACLFLPVACATAYFTLRPGQKPGVWQTLALAALSFPIALVLSIITGCNLAGACF